ncbi:alpha/beta hydrolase family protein [Actinoplanes couchii]|uniref:Acyl-CoA thioester hydrolase n=1 Tax=Actinoplanes couchii TaxID=403638 RepID=A0ABQ3XND8_9ACTN|nr:alpha/beta fold hydrolase [Actinoplanes couchii]MDR6318044.1 pimeloyl-ACP methyl ester carboxylesterase [Actinoplanes couchii]GID60039.1 acyl-CoA thioester hydrolase [Actinoplanes couchii]
MPEVEMTAEAHDGLLLAGTLTRPGGPGPHPAVLLLHGSGPLDRDGNTRRQRLDLGPSLAAVLARHGIATLRYDRRGVGATPGDWRSTGFIDTRRDAAAALRALAARPDIQAGAIGVVGHSEGAVHAMALGAQSPDASPAVAAVVLLAGFARTGEEALRHQADMIADSLPPLVRKPLLSLFTRYLARVQATSSDVARVAGMPVNARWMRELLTHDPRPDLANIRVPVLAVTGGKDLQVDPTDLDAIHRLVPGRAEIHRVGDLTHLLRRDPGPASLRTYSRQLRRPVDPELLTRITTWLHTSLKGPTP